MDKIEFSDFEKVELRVGTIIRAESFPEARKPAYKLFIDFGEEIGEKQSSAQITDLYTLEELPKTQVLAVLNLGSRRIGPFTSEVLVTGFPDSEGRVVLARPSFPVPNGSKLF